MSLTMTHFHFRLRFLSLALLAAAGSVSAQSGVPTQSVEVRAAGPVPVRTDLQQVCPDARVDLPDALARTAQEVATASVVAVQFEIDGSLVRAVQTQGGVGTQARAVRRAVHSLACSNGQAGRERVQFSVRFVDPFDRSQRVGQTSGQHMALVEVAGAQ
jgi:hypothetical protein